METISMSLILDAVTVVVAVLFVLIGFHRGFIKSVVRLVGFVAAVIVSAIVSSPVAQLLFDNMFRAQLETFVREKVQEGAAAAAVTLGEQVEQVITSLPEGVQSLLSLYGVDVTGLSGSALATDDLIPTVMEQVIEPVCCGALQLIVFLVLFLVLYIVIRMLGGLLDKIFAALPVIKQANGLLGGVLGFAEGVLILFVLCYGLQLYMTLAGADSVITVEDINKTYLLSFVMELNPIL